MECKEREHVDGGIETAQEWIDRQARLWAEAKQRRGNFVRLVQGWRAPVQMAKLMDGLLDIVKSLHRENDASETVQLNAMAAIG
jgi:hypothetical protein